ncbi:MAG: phage tail tape measure protein, partial [Erysipelotrichaceae bacterium]|nr:phage tail tape measure protein [Erysipelotrichaceae bacterium]
MANRIKGITVEIGGDTTKLQSALKGVNTQIRDTQSQLRDVDKLLKLDPGNTQLLTQKQQLLSQAVADTKTKLETLKVAATQANDALANGKITQEQYDALQREIIETTKNLEGLESQAGESATALQKVSIAGEKLQTSGDGLVNAGKKLTVVSAAIGAVGGASASMAMEFEDAMAKVNTIADTSQVPLEELEDSIIELSNQTGVSSSEIAQNVYDA